MWAFKKLSGSCLYYFLYLHFIREILRFSCSSILKTARLFSGASPYEWCIIGSTPQASNTLSKSHSPRVLYPSPLPSPSSFTSQCFLELLKHTAGKEKKLSTQQHFSFILMSCFMISTLFSIAVPLKKKWKSQTTKTKQVSKKRKYKYF